MAELSKAERADLSSVGWNWGGAYRCWHEDGKYRARRKGATDPKNDLTADSTSELRGLIRTDYFEWIASIGQDEGSMSL